MHHPNHSHEHVELRAYEIWQQHGGSYGRHEADWYQVERELGVQPDNSLVGVARRVGAALGSAVSLTGDALKSELRSTT
jgi:hypothetical protein